MSSLDRRKFVSAVGAGAVGMFATGTTVYGQTPSPPPQGRHTVKPLKYAPDVMRGISTQVIQWHHGRHYTAYVNNRNLNEQQLAQHGPGTSGFDPRVYAGIKRDEAWNASGQILHEVYFDNIGGNGQPGDGPVERAVTSAFGSIENWVADLTVIGGQATGWALLCYDPSDGYLHNYLVDQHQFHGVWGAIPIVALDVFEHAYYHDYGPDRGSYIRAFFQNLHWGRINERYG